MEYLADHFKPPSKHSLAVVSPTDSKMSADLPQQEEVIDLLDDDDGDSSNEKPSGNEGNEETAKTDFIDLSGSAEPKSDSGARPECIDLSRFDEPVTN